MSFHRAGTFAVASLLGCLLLGQAAEARGQGLGQGVFLSVDQAAQRVIGKKVWITTTDGGQLEGKVLAATSSQLALSIPGSGAEQISLSSIRRIDARKSSRRGMMWGIAIGAASGVTFGTFIAVTSDGTRGAGTVWGTGIALGSAGGLLGYMLSSGRTTVFVSSGSAVVAVVPQIGRGVVGARVQVRW